jgi:hypothetical protein
MLDTFLWKNSPARTVTAVRCTPSGRKRKHVSVVTMTGKFMAWEWKIFLAFGAMLSHLSSWNPLSQTETAV